MLLTIGTMLYSRYLQLTHVVQLKHYVMFLMKLTAAVEHAFMTNVLKVAAGVQGLENAPGSFGCNVGSGGVRKAIPEVYLCVVKFPFMITVAGKGCVMVLWEAVLMQMISGKRELAIIHENLGQNESINALIGCK